MELCCRVPFEPLRHSNSLQMSRQYLKAAVTSDAAADIQAKSHKQKPYRPVDEEDYTVKSVEAKLYNFNDLSPGSDSQKMSNDLPAEIIAQISSYVAQFPSSQNSLCACSYVSRSWYAASVAFLYETPQISGKNFDQFVRTVCPSINAHVRVNGLAELVRRLDMSNLVHNGSKSLTARLLGRVKGNLVVFVAPQASFAYVSESPRTLCQAYILVASTASQHFLDAPS